MSLMQSFNQFSCLIVRSFVLFKNQRFTVNSYDLYSLYSMIPRAMISRQYCRHGLNRYAQSASTFSTKFCKYLNVYLKIVVSVAEENYCSTSSHGRIKSKLFSTFILHKGGQNARCSNQAFTLILTKLF